jgi:hypothetical protein
MIGLAEKAQVDCVRWIWLKLSVVPIAIFYREPHRHLDIGIHERGWPTEETDGLAPAVDELGEAVAVGVCDFIVAELLSRILAAQ